MQQKPHGSCGSLEDPPVLGLAEHPGVPVQRVMVRPDAEDSSTRGDQRGRKPLRRPGDHELRRGLAGFGTTAVEPGRTGSSAFEATELSTSYSSESEAVEHCGRRGARGAAMRFWPFRSKEHRKREPHERQRTQRVRKAGGRASRRGGEKPRGRMVPGLWKARVIRIPSLTSLKGHETPGGATRSARTGEGITARTLRGR
jgi:hypothetical protein